MKIVTQIVRLFKRQRRMSLYQMLDANLNAGHLRYGWEVVR